MGSGKMSASFRFRGSGHSLTVNSPSSSPGRETTQHVKDIHPPLAPSSVSLPSPSSSAPPPGASSAAPGVLAIWPAGTQEQVRGSCEKHLQSSPYQPFFHGCLSNSDTPHIQWQMSTELPHSSHISEVTAEASNSSCTHEKKS